MMEFKPTPHPRSHPHELNQNFIFNFKSLMGNSIFKKNVDLAYLCIPHGTLPGPIPVGGALQTFCILLIGYCMHHNYHIYIHLHRF